MALLSKAILAAGISLLGISAAHAEIIGGVDFPQGAISTRLAPSVPEPATWAMLIAGFGLTGAAMRRNSARGAQRLA